MVAIPLMSTPLFFQETHFYSDSAIAEIKPFLAAYKSIRYGLYESLVFPIGNEPSNQSWAGFQAHHTEKKMGFLTIFREIENLESEQTIQMKFLKNQKVKFSNLRNGDKFKKVANNEGFVRFEILKKGDFRFLKYE